MRNLIINAFAFKENYATSPQLEKKVNDKILDTYMKNIFVSLKSASINNPSDDVAIIVNEKLPDKYMSLFKKNNIKVFIIKFDKYEMPKSFKWALAFLKLCALDYAVHNLDYKNYLLLDADTISVNEFSDLWKETQNKVLLYDINHNISHKGRSKIINDYKNIYGEEKNIIQYGGEFICGNKKLLSCFLKECYDVYEKIKLSDYRISVDAGDETIISIAASRVNIIMNAAAYICRYWTGRFYLVSTNYYNDPVLIWHLPTEKKLGLLYMYNYYAKHKHFPKIKKMAKVFGFIKARRPITIIGLYNFIKSKSIK